MSRLNYARRRRVWNTSGGSTSKPQSAVSIARQRVAICVADLKHHRGNRAIKKRRLAHAQAMLLKALAAAEKRPGVKLQIDALGSRGGI